VLQTAGNFGERSSAVGVDRWPGIVHDSGQAVPVARLDLPPSVARVQPVHSAQRTPGVVNYPYAKAIRDLMGREQIGPARRLLRSAISHRVEDPDIEVLQRMLAPPVVRPSAQLDRDRSDDYAWLREHGAEHRGRWVAVSRSELVVEALTLRELRVEIKRRGLSEAPLVHWIR
jgi:hypothetical protein